MLKLFMIYFLLLIILIIILIKSIKKKELFSQHYIIADNKDNVIGAHNIKKDDFQKIILSIENTDISNDILKSLGFDNDKITIYLDPYINYFVLNNKNISNNDEYNDGIFICLTPNKLKIHDSVWNIENKTIAYNFMSDYLFIQAIIKGYRLDINKIKFIKINNDDLNSFDINFDFFITYVVIDSKYMKFIENSQFYINGLVDVDLNRILPFYPFVKQNLKNMREYFNNGEIKEYVNNKNKVCIPIMNYRRYTIDKTENFISRLDIPSDFIGDINKKQTEYTTSSYGYGCYGDIDVNNKHACNSKYTIIGEPKGFFSVWDKKCDNDLQCPYYKSNANYPNKRGGCGKDGFCEFPAGVKIQGFTKYDNENLNSPFCYGCIDTMDVNCCKKQKTPDYAFPNDFVDRKNNNKKTVITLLDYENF